MKRRLKKVEKEVESWLNLPSCSSELTPAEIEVGLLLRKEFLTVKQIAIRRGTSDKAIYKLIKTLKKKGGLVPQEIMVEKKRCTIQPKVEKGVVNSTFVSHGIRLHGQEWNIKLVWKSERYRKILKKSNFISVDGNNIRLYRNSLEVYSGQSFFADNVEKATEKSIKYFNRLFKRLEHDFHVIILKNRFQNINLVKHHYAEINNELAKDCNVNADKIKVFATEDNKLWFMIDNSFNLHEAETCHGDTAELDMRDVVVPFFNELRDKKVPLLSDVMKLIGEMAVQNKESANGLNGVVSVLKSQFFDEKKEEASFFERPEYIG